MTDLHRCPQCGREIPADSPGGLCPNCLIREAGPGEPASTTPTRSILVPPSPDELAGLFPQLEIQELIGHGGMGAVYRARQTKLDRVVALKIIRPESADDPTFAERFNREARTLARLNHPGIVGVYDFGEVLPAGGDGPSIGDEAQQPAPLYYFVMEYVDGVNLRQVLEEGQLPAPQALGIVSQTCDALQYAHEEGIVHRDIKPENILLDTKGRVKIADFGLAKLAAPSEQDFSLTATHQVVGTPRYMAPEQMEGSRAVDHRADIYSLGVVFYEMLTGEVPAGHFEPPSRQSGVDARLDEIVLRALARDPGRRYQQASQISSQVNAIRGVTSDPYGTPSSVSLRDVPPAGPSTMLEHGLGRVIGGVRRGAVGQGLAHPNAPGVVAMLLGIGLAGTLLMQWGVWYVDTPERKSGGTIHGFSLPYSAMIGALGFVLAVTLFAAGTTLPVPRWRGKVVLLAGIVTLGLCWLFRRAAIVMDDVVGRMQIDEGFPVALGLGIALIVVGAWDMRQLRRVPVADSASGRQRRFSRKAIAGAVLAAVSLLMLLSLAAAGISTGGFETVLPEDILRMFVLPAVAAGTGATILGCMAITEIRNSGGRLEGLGLAFGGAVLFPACLTYALPASLLFAVTSMKGFSADPPESDLVVALLIAAVLWIPAAIFLLPRLWRAVSGPVESQTTAWTPPRKTPQFWRTVGETGESAQPAAATTPPPTGQEQQRSANPPDGDSRIGGRDWVTLTREQIEADALPDVCIVCGAPASEHVSREFTYQAEWAQILTMAGMCAFVLPGLIIEALTRQQRRIACPVCRQHVHFWSRFQWWAALGWLIPVVLGCAGLLISWALWPSDFPVTDQNGVAVLIGAAIGLIVYLVPLIRMFLTRIDAEEITDTSIRLRRVSAAFARAVQQAKQSAK